MNVKEYLNANSSPIFSDEYNYLTLSWIGTKGYSTEETICKETQLPFSKLSKALHILFRNELVEIGELGYSVTKLGYKCLNKFKTSEIKFILDKTVLLSQEKQIYYEILSQWRNDFTDIYNIFLFILDQSFSEAKRGNYYLYFKSNKHETESEEILNDYLFTYLIGSYLTIFIKNMPIKNYYINIESYKSSVKLFDYCKLNSCITSEVLKDFTTHRNAYNLHDIIKSFITIYYPSQNLGNSKQYLVPCLPGSDDNLLSKLDLKDILEATNLYELSLKMSCDDETMKNLITKINLHTMVLLQSNSKSIDQQ